MTGGRQLNVGKLPSALLQRLIDRYVPSDPSILIGPQVGADAAAISIDTSAIVVKSDPITFPTPEMARYLVNVNANDVVCMGATPRWLLVTALLPEHDTFEDDVEDLFRQLAAECRKLGISLAGGHTEVTSGIDRPLLIGALIGEANPVDILDLRNSQPGDHLLLCGSVAIEGTAILANEAEERLLDAVPAPLLAAAKRLIESPGMSVIPAAKTLISSDVVVRGMHDPTEGGIATAIHEVATVTHSDVVIESTLDFLPETVAISSALDLDPRGVIASGALLAVVGPQSVERAKQALSAADIPVQDLGRLREATGRRPRVIDVDGLEMPVFHTDEVARYFSELGAG